MKKQYLLLLVVLTFVTGCSSVRVREQWQSQDAPRRFDKFLVLSISKEPGIRRIAEDSIAATFKKAGVEAIAAYTLDTGDEPPSKEQLRTHVKTSGAAAILISRTVKVEHRSEYIPIAPDYCGGFYNDYDCFWRDPFYDRGFVSHYQVGTMEADLYGANEDRLLWSAVVTVEFEHFSRRAIEDYAQAIVEALGKQGFLAVRRPPEN